MNDAPATGRHPDGRITVEQRGQVLLMGLDRIEKRNGVTPKMLAELSAAYARLEVSDDLRVGLLFAHGDHFSGGIDLPQIAARRHAGLAPWDLAEVDPFDLQTAPRSKPVVIALQGICFTVAVELMLACDIAVASADCRFSQLEVQRGIMPSQGATVRMVQSAGWGNAMELLLTGREFDAHHAQRLGFVQRIVAAGTQFEAGLQLAQAVADQAPLAVRAIRANALQALGSHGLQAWKDLASLQARLYGSEDAREGLQSFSEKRQARFVGR